MRLGTFLLLFSSTSTVKSYSTNLPPYSTLGTSTETDQIPPLQLVAIPDYPVVAGPTVKLYCNTLAKPPQFRLSWQRLERQTWREVGQGWNLILNEPKQSGLYRCRAETKYNKRESNVTTVYIIATQPTVAEKLGITGFVLSLLALIATLTILCWLAWQRFGGTLTPLNTAAKGFPGPEKAPKGCFPQTEGDGDVYMNYTNTNQAYSNLDPANMTGDNVYSSLS